MRRRWALGVVAVALLLREAAAARLLRQTTESITSFGVNNLDSITTAYAQAHEAEAKSLGSTRGIFHNEATVINSAGDALPFGRSTAMTHGGEDEAGRTRSGGGNFLGAAIQAFGPVAIAATSTGARAFSGANAMPLIAQDHLDHDASHGATTVLYDVSNLRSGGAGKLHSAYTDSIGVTYLAPLSSGISNTGGGPIAIASAGQAVAVANADTLRNEGRGIQ